MKMWQLDSLAQMLRAERVVHWQPKELWQMHIQLLLEPIVAKYKPDYIRNYLKGGNRLRSNPTFYIKVSLLLSLITVLASKQLIAQNNV